jgi:hypothetical protein
MADTVSKADFDLCDRENSNLRRHLLWAAQRMGPADLAELRSMLADKTITDGGFVGEQADADRADLVEARRLALALTDLVDELVASPRHSTLDRLAGRLDDKACALRNVLGPEPGHTLTSFLQAEG